MHKGILNLFRSKIRLNDTISGHISADGPADRRSFPISRSPATIKTAGNGIRTQLPETYRFSSITTLRFGSTPSLLVVTFGFD